jgi:hypothetical protein
MQDRRRGLFFFPGIAIALENQAEGQTKLGHQLNRKLKTENHPYEHPGGGR